MQIAATCMVKNECDVIELFARHTLSMVDKLVIMNHFSTDPTVEILQCLIDEGLNIEIVHLEDPSYQQSRFTTRAVRDLARTGQFDYIFPLDADEFLSCADRDDLVGRLADQLPPDGFGEMLSVTYVPDSAAVGGAPNDPWADFFARTREPNDYVKVVLGGAFAKDATVAMGNHGASHPDFPSKPVRLDFTLQHVPIRTSEQLMRKVLVSSYTNLMKPNRKALDGIHWTEMANDVRKNGYSVSANELFRTALFTGGDAEKDADIELDKTRGLKLAPEARQKYHHLAQIDILSALDGVAQNLLDALLASRSQQPVPFPSVRKMIKRQLRKIRQRSGA